MLYVPSTKRESGDNNAQTPYDLLPSGEWWDTIPADIDRWGARKFTIGPFTAPVWTNGEGAWRLDLDHISRGRRHRTGSVFKVPVFVVPQLATLASWA